MQRREQRKKKIFYGVDVIDTADEGLSIGRCEDGLIIQIRGAVPGDKVDAVVIEKRKGMFIAKVMDIHTFSPDRVDPFCIHFGTCGGCKWQHMAYPAQLRYKEKKVRDAFQRIGGLDAGLVKPIVGASLQTYYRNKLEYTASDRRWLTEAEMQGGHEIEQRDGIGFHLVGEFNKVIDIVHCYLQPDPSNDIRQFIKKICRENQWSFSNLKYKTGYLRNIIIRNNLAGDVMVVIVVGEDDNSKMDLLVSQLVAAFPRIVSVYSCFNPKVNDSIYDLEVKLAHGEDGLLENLENVVYKIGPKSFFQTNSFQAGTLYQLAREMAALRPEDVVYDLYCGVGSLGLFMADQCKSVVGIEQTAESIVDAKLNATLNGYTNAQFVTGQVESILDPVFVATYGKPDVIITDPPRAGMHPDVVAHLAESGADRIVYVSCNPATQARDLKMLSHRYQLISAVPVDMFPHTHHIECVALLTRI